MDKGIEPWVALEDVNKPDDKQVLIKTSRLSDQGQGLVKTSKKYYPRRQTSSVNRMEV